MACDESFANNNVSLNNVNDYLRSISKYSLLSDEELLYYGKNLKLVDNLEIVKKSNGRYSHYDLDYSIVLSSLTKTKYHDTILKLLIKNLKNTKNKSDVKLIPILKKYQKLCNDKKPNLSDIDLIEYFNIGVNEIKPIDEIQFLSEIKNYFLYCQAREKIINSNLRLVYSIAKNYFDYMEFIDLIQEGNLGLINAVDNYDVDLGYKFSTYASKSIKNTICRAINKDKVHLKYNFKHISLNQPIFDNKEETLEDVIQSDVDLDDEISKLTLKDEVNKIFEKMGILTELEKNVLKMRYGFNKYGTCTLKEIGEMLDISYERVARLEISALRKIRIYALHEEKILSLRKYI